MKGPMVLCLADWKKLGWPYCGVYVAAPERGHPVKVGISTCVPKRISSLQTSLTNKLYVHGYRLCLTMKDARQIEAHVHRVLKDRNKLLAGEWFDVRPKEAVEEIDWAGVSMNIGVFKELPEEAWRVGGKLRSLWMKTFSKESDRLAGKFFDENLADPTCQTWQYHAIQVL